eukprot:8663271-Karenia_brevis.AAC.1
MVLATSLASSLCPPWSGRLALIWMMYFVVVGKWYKVDVIAMYGGIGCSGVSVMNSISMKGVSLLQAL